MTTWFEAIFDEYAQRSEAMFAFSRAQVEEVVPFEVFQRDWVDCGAGMYVKQTVAEEFQRRCREAFDADQAMLPVVTVTYIGATGWMEYPTYKVMDNPEGVDLDNSRYLVDIDLGEPGTASVLYPVTSEGEPTSGLCARIVYAPVDVEPPSAPPLRVSGPSTL